MDITHRKADNQKVKAFATDYEAFRYAEKPEFDRWSDSLNTLLSNLLGSGWAVTLCEMENGATEYAQALKVGKRNAVAKYQHSREDGISSIEIAFCK